MYVVPAADLNRWGPRLQHRAGDLDFEPGQRAAVRAEGVVVLGDLERRRKHLRGDETGQADGAKQTS